MQIQMAQEKTSTVVPTIKIADEVERHYLDRGWSWAIGFPAVFSNGIAVPDDSGIDKIMPVNVHRINSEHYHFDPEINVWLSIVECFGLDAGYSQAFVKYVEHEAGNICLHAFSRMNIRPRGAKYFRGRIVDRNSFKKMFEKFFDEFGVSVVYPR